MQTTKKKPNILLIVLGAIISAFLGYLVAGRSEEHTSELQSPA